MSPAIHDPTTNEHIFRPQGYGRFSGAAFLALWLCLWVVGEGFVLLILGYGLWSLLTGCPAFSTGEPLRTAPALVGGLFLLVWLSFWTLGGVMAFREILRLLWAEDRLVIERDALQRLRRRGPFKSIRLVARRDIRHIFVQNTTKTLMLQVGANLVELTDLGTPEQRTTAMQQLRFALGLPDEKTAPEEAALPDDWQISTGPLGERLLVPNPRNRRKQAIALSIFTGVISLGVILLARNAVNDPNMWPITLMLGALAAWLVKQTLWLLRGRKEWRIESGRLVCQRRFADKVTELYQARALELTESRDSDGDRWYHLHAIDLAPSPHAVNAKIPEKDQIAQALRDATDPRCVGQWIARHTTIPLHDRIPTEADKQAERARMIRQLAGTGKFGRFIADRMSHTRND